LFGNTPAKLFFGHKTIENHNIWMQFIYKSIKTGFIKLNRNLLNTYSLKVESIAGFSTGTGKGYLVIFLSKHFYKLHHSATCRRTFGFWPNKTYNQEFFS